MKKIVTFTLLSLLTISTYAQPNIQWQKTLGGSEDDAIQSIKKTTDGGFIIAGKTNSKDSDFFTNHGGTDMWVSKLTQDGITQWTKTLGGSDFDNASAVQPTNDGGYIVVGNTESIDGDVSNNHGLSDLWVVKLNNFGGIQWEKTFGGSQTDAAFSVQQTSDGGFIVAGSTESNDGDVSGNHGLGDFWILKLNDTGSIQWQQVLGGTYSDHAHSIQQTTDGGFIVAGGAGSLDGDVLGNHGQDGSTDYWVIKLSGSGVVEWKKAFGGYRNETAYAIRQTNDGGYIVSGYAVSTDGQVFLLHGFSDCWMLKLSNTGEIQWRKALGGSDFDYSTDLIQSSNGKFVLAGVTLSNDDNVSGNHGNEDFWVVQINSGGTLQWQKTLGGSKDDVVYSIEQANDGGYILAGYTKSNDGDVSGNHGGWDGWLVKLSPESVGAFEALSAQPLEIFPNPVTNFLQIKTASEESNLWVSISDLSGRQISQQNILNGESIDVSPLPNGTYSVVATTTSGQVYTATLQIQK